MVASISTTGCDGGAAAALEPQHAAEAQHVQFTVAAGAAGGHQVQQQQQQQQQQRVSVGASGPPAAGGCDVAAGLAVLVAGWIIRSDLL
jgi:hypothetical protein